MKALAEERRELIWQFGGKCSVCGSTEELHFHHIFKTKLHGEGRGMRNRVGDVKRHPISYKLVCKMCHFIIHSNYK